MKKKNPDNEGGTILILVHDDPFIVAAIAVQRFQPAPTVDWPGAFRRTRAAGEAISPLPISPLPPPDDSRGPPCDTDGSPPAGGSLRHIENAA